MFKCEILGLSLFPIRNFLLIFFSINKLRCIDSGVRNLYLQVILFLGLYSPFDLFIGILLWLHMLALQMRTKEDVGIEPKTIRFT
jgi:hypothetical protein